MIQKNLRIYQFFAIFCFLFISVSSQSIYDRFSASGLIQFRYHYTKFKEFEDITFKGMNLFISYHAPILNNLNLRIELPVGYGYEKYNPGSMTYENDTKIVIGNPFAGLELLSHPSIKTLLGIRIPVGPGIEIARSMAHVGEINKFSAFIHQYLSLNGHIFFNHNISDHAEIRLMTGGILFVNTDKQNYEDNTEFQHHYGLLISYSAESLVFAISINGFQLTSVEGNFGERSIHQLDFSVGRRGKFSPTLLVRFPLDADLKDMYKFIVGIHGTYQLK